MTEDHARYDHDTPGSRTPGPEHIGDILRRLAEQEGWNQHLQAVKGENHRTVDPLTNGRHRG